jgi:hypothetical protein
MGSNGDAFDFIQTQFVIAAIVEFRRSRTLVIRKLLSLFQRSAVSQVVRNTRGAKRVAADRGFDAGGGGSAFHHVVDIATSHPFECHDLRLSANRAKQRLLLLVPQTRRFQKRIEIFFELVMAGHIV